MVVSRLVRTVSRTLPGTPIVGTVPPLWAVKHLDGPEDVGACLVVIAVDPPLDPPGRVSMNLPMKQRKRLRKHG